MVGGVVGAPVAVPPLEPGVGLPRHGLPDPGVLVRVDVAGDVACRDPELPQQRDGHVGEVLAHALGVAPHGVGVGVHAGDAGFVGDPFGDPAQDLPGCGIGRLGGLAHLLGHGLELLAGRGQGRGRDVLRLGVEQVRVPQLLPAHPLDVSLRSRGAVHVHSGRGAHLEHGVAVGDVEIGHAGAEVVDVVVDRGRRRLHGQLGRDDVLLVVADRGHARLVVRARDRALVGVAGDVIDLEPAHRTPPNQDASWAWMKYFSLTAFEARLMAD